eukprot:GHRR01030395.1.p1 GENE.GHRR01030395.1~~GHRR01030395.1.p1  ORF type:complete len:283 (+),score=121.13 GHRR01030395.1:282-1130(+)
MYTGKPGGKGSPATAQGLDSSKGSGTVAVLGRQHAHEVTASDPHHQQHPGHWQGGYSEPSEAAAAGADGVMGMGGSTAAGMAGSLRGPALDVYGQPRGASPTLPATYRKSTAPAGVNADYLAREAATMRTSKTSSSSLIQAHKAVGQQLVLSPGHIHFGSVAAGAVVHRSARLLNSCANVVRFTVVRPQLPLRVLYKPAPLAPGMEAVLTVELVAEEPGDYVGEVTVNSEINVLALTVSAKVLPNTAADSAVLSSAGGTADAGVGSTQQAAGLASSQSVSAL